MATGKCFLGQRQGQRAMGKKNFAQRQRKWQREKRCFQNPDLESRNLKLLNYHP